MRTLTRIHVRYGETDKMAVVYHANYALYFEDARTDFLAKLGFPWNHYENEGIVSPVATMHADYHQPLRYGDVAVVRTHVSDVSPVRVTFHYEVFREGMDYDADKPLVTGWSVHCLTDAKTGRPLSMKRVTPQLYAAYQQAAESAER